MTVETNASIFFSLGLTLFLPRRSDRSHGARSLWTIVKKNDEKKRKCLGIVSETSTWNRFRLDIFVSFFSCWWCIKRDKKSRFDIVWKFNDVFKKHQLGSVLRVNFSHFIIHLEWVSQSYFRIDTHCHIFLQGEKFRTFETCFPEIGNRRNILVDAYRNTGNLRSPIPGSAIFHVLRDWYIRISIQFVTIGKVSGN